MEFYFRYINDTVKVQYGIALDVCLKQIARVHEIRVNIFLVVERFFKVVKYMK